MSSLRWFIEFAHTKMERHTHTHLPSLIYSSHMHVSKNRLTCAAPIKSDTKNTSTVTMAGLL